MTTPIEGLFLANRPRSTPRTAGTNYSAVLGPRAAVEAADQVDVFGVPVRPAVIAAADEAFAAP